MIPNIMIERGFNEAQRLSSNKGAVRQKAIAQARRILEAAGVVDPAIKDQTATIRPQDQAAEHDFYVIPEGIGVRSTLEIGGKSAEQLEEEMKQAGINISAYTRYMLYSLAFTTLDHPQEVELLKLRVQDLGLSGTPTTNQIFERAQKSTYGEFRLGLCPAEVGPHQRLSDTDQPLNDWYTIAMHQITGRLGSPRVFVLARDARGLGLYDRWAEPYFQWVPDDRIVFSLRKFELLKP